MTKEERLLQLTPKEREQRNQLFDELLERQNQHIEYVLEELFQGNTNTKDECRSQLYCHLYLYLEDVLAAKKEKAYVEQCLKNCLNTIYAQRKRGLAGDPRGA